MRTALLTLAPLLVVGSWLPLPAAGAEEAPDEQEAADRHLCEAVVASPFTLEEGLAQVASSGTVLSAAFRWDEDALVLEILAAPAEPGGPYRAFEGPVGEHGWQPTARPLEASDEAAAAARLATLRTLAPVALADVCRRALRARGSKGRKPGRLIAVEPAASGDAVTFACRVVVEGLPWTTYHRADGALRGFERPAYLAAREEAAKSWLGRPLPEVDLDRGTWLNVEEPARLAGWKGAYVLLLLTDPG